MVHIILKCCLVSFNFGIFLTIYGIYIKVNLNLLSYYKIWSSLGAEMLLRTELPVVTSMSQSSSKPHEANDTRQVNTVEVAILCIT